VSLCSKTRENASVKTVWISWDLGLNCLLKFRADKIDIAKGIQPFNRLQYLETAP